MPAAALAHVRLSAGKEVPPEVEMSIPGLDWGVDEVMGKETKKVPQKKVPYAKPIPAQFQQVAEDGQGLVPTSPPSCFSSFLLSWMNFQNNCGDLEPSVCRPGRRIKYP